MTRRMSISQINALGERLRRATTPSAEDFGALNELQGDYLAPMIAVQQRLKGQLNLDAHARLKNPHTVVEKLVRDKTRLSKMQDIAGLRVVEDVDLTGQDELVESISAMFAGARLHDRRAEPSFGYRAIHVVVQVGDCPVEIQVRTRLQDAWANAMEIVGDRVGRFVRYEPPPARGTLPGLLGEDEQPATSDDAAASDSMTVAGLVSLLYRWTDVIVALEEAQKSAADLQEDVDRTSPLTPDDDAYPNLTDSIELLGRYKERLPRLKSEVLAALDDLVGGLETYELEPQ